MLSNEWRHNKVTSLLSALTTSDNVVIERATMPLKMYGSRPADTGFSMSDLEYAINRLNGKLNGFTTPQGKVIPGMLSTLNYNKKTITDTNRRIASSNGVGVKPDVLRKRDGIARDVYVMAKKVNHIQTAITILTDVIAERKAPRPVVAIEPTAEVKTVVQSLVVEAPVEVCEKQINFKPHHKAKRREPRIETTLNGFEELENLKLTMTMSM